MKTIKFCIMVMILIGLSGTAHAESGVVIHNPFVTGNQFIELSPKEQLGYVKGIVDGIFLAPMFKSNKDDIIWFEKCVEGMNDGQVLAILNKHISDNPARRHNGAHILFFQAFYSACQK